MTPTAPSAPNRFPGTGYGSPPADTGNQVLNWVSDQLTALVRVERRVDPFFRPVVRRAAARAAVGGDRQAAQRAAQR